MDGEGTRTGLTIANLAWALDGLVALFDGDAVAQGAVQPQLLKGFIKIIFSLNFAANPKITKKRCHGAGMLVSAWSPLVGT